jgi:hypothetical protein
LNQAASCSGTILGAAQVTNPVFFQSRLICAYPLFISLPLNGDNQNVYNSVNEIALGIMPSVMIFITQS